MSDTTFEKKSPHRTDLPPRYRDDESQPRHVDAGRYRAALEAIGEDRRTRVFLVATPGLRSFELTLITAGKPRPVFGAILPALNSVQLDIHDHHTRPAVSDSGLELRIEVFSLTRTGHASNPAEQDPDLAARLDDAIRAMWSKDTEVDGFNRLISHARLTWREAAVMRAYSRYLHQLGLPYSQEFVESVLDGHPVLTRALIDLFLIRLNPDLDDEGTEAALGEDITDSIDAVPNLDADRVLRALASAIRATVRTNYFCMDSTGTPRPALTLKLATSDIREAPLPRPEFEIFVHSPAIEGVHLRYGRVSRGGLRWSNRTEDLRTEILGLAKAQEVKNALIVPAGAKGGYIVKSPDTVSPEDLRAQGEAGYQLFIQSMLDVTDTTDPCGRIQGPARVARLDGDDPYLVVAADKGTASFSDLANSIALDNGFWLGDAFASGGSSGYDHKKMGITARGAWESVRRHFRELGIDDRRTDFTAVGIGDMSGDVFGNGMLLSTHLCLIAAFDHRQIFLDPNPDPTTSYAERRRLFELPNSSWSDYNSALLSAGGGVWSRTAKSIPVSDEIRRRLGLSDTVTALTPNELIQAILTAPVDLLWSAGIGTYVKASTETHPDVADKVNDRLRVDADRLRARVIGEGGNLGLTQRARIEYASRGGHINTDALDNSAGVDCSDHEVNIKVLLARRVQQGTLTLAERDALMRAMEGDVAEQVLDNNRTQAGVIALSDTNSADLTDVYARMVTSLEANGDIDRELAALPSSAEFDAIARAGQRLTSPELSVLMAHIKRAFKRGFLESPLIDSPVFDEYLLDYFSPLLRDRFREGILDHPLRREIVATTVTNRIVGSGGVSFAFRLREETGANIGSTVRAYCICEALFGLENLHKRAGALDPSVDISVVNQVQLDLRLVLDRAAAWFVTNRPQPLDIALEIDRLRPVLREVTRQLRKSHSRVARRAQILAEEGLPADLADDIADITSIAGLLDVLEIAHNHGDVSTVVDVFVELGSQLNVEMLTRAVNDIEIAGNRWHFLARLALREQLSDAMRTMTEALLSDPKIGQTLDEKITAWKTANSTELIAAHTETQEACQSGTRSVETLTVAIRRLRVMAKRTAMRAAQNPTTTSGTAHGQMALMVERSS